MESEGERDLCGAGTGGRARATAGVHAEHLGLPAWD
eukprot:CAMPEP_0174343942 /NCGR_PEP_ID=MMETSP0810-20121108/27362_1 /TAXON_ID=73025 ORGANISM="Eutreptiella gymnastica-like, Strain CCMP1594" /NCGR_SAMPLE_ID=MMETSP0810 /ASSEMBLY_ACC=CAM_ASM_000659 /LENGTH=35 /DNA_ID= /DNA_START= /DNA_END= /DNA_ORIENTATION=